MIKGIIAETKYDGKSENGKMIRIEVDGEKKFYFTGEAVGAFETESLKLGIGNSILFECEDKNGTGMLTSIKLDDGKAVAKKPKVEKKKEAVKETKKEEKSVVEEKPKDEKEQPMSSFDANTQELLFYTTARILNSLQGMIEPSNVAEVIEKVYKKLESFI